MSETTDRLPAWLKRLNYVSKWEAPEGIKIIYARDPNDESIGVHLLACCLNTTVWFYDNETLEGCHEVLNKAGRDLIRNNEKAHAENQKEIDHVKEVGENLGEKLRQAGFGNFFMGPVIQPDQCNDENNGDDESKDHPE